MPAPGEIRDTREYEGLRLGAYKDSVGVPTVGYGFNLNRADARKQLSAVGADYDAVRTGKAQLTKDQADALFNVTYGEARSSAQKLLSNFIDQPEIIKKIITDLVFNMGEAGVGKFKRTLSNLANKDYLAAASSLKQSKWYGQVGRRSKEIVGALAYLGSGSQIG